MKPAMRIASESGKALPRKVNLTARYLETLKCPEGQNRAWVYDARTRGLAVMVTAAGAKTYYLYRRVHGRPQRYRIAAVDEISVDEARDKAEKLNGEIVDGANPQLDRNKTRAETTFGEGFTRYLEQHAKLKKRTWKEDEAKYKQHLKPWANRRLSSIGHEDVQALHSKIGASAPGAANRTLSLLSKVFNFLRVEPNPCKGIVKFPEHSRERFLQPDELPKLFKAIEGESQVWQDFFKTCLFTGARSGNVQKMRWDEIDLDGARWVIPPEKFKTGRPMTVPLVAEVVQILKRRKSEQEARAKEVGITPPPWVFNTTAECGHLTHPQSAWDRIKEQSGLADLRIHDLRRSLGSWQASTGANLTVISKTLGHTATQTTAIYARVNLDPVRAAVNTAVAAMQAAAKAQVAKAEAKEQR